MKPNRSIPKCDYNLKKKLVVKRGEKNENDQQ